MLKLVVITLVAMTVLCGPMGAVAAELKIGVADGNSLLAGSAEGKRAQENIKRKGDELSRPLGTKRQDLSRQVEEFQKQAGMMKEAARKAKQQELEKKMADFEKQTQEAQKQLSQMQEKEMAPVLQKLEAAVKTVAQEDKIDIVFDKRSSGLLYVAPNLDITDKVRAKFGR
jgi:outer membrane protein